LFQYVYVPNCLPKERVRKRENVKRRDEERERERKREREMVSTVFLIISLWITSYNKFFPK